MTSITADTPRAERSIRRAAAVIVVNATGAVEED